MMNLKFISIEQVREIKSKYALKACEEDGQNPNTNEILWYASYAIKVYERMGESSNIKKDIKEFRQAIGEMILNFKLEDG